MFVADRLHRIPLRRWLRTRFHAHLDCRAVLSHLNQVTVLRTEQLIKLFKEVNEPPQAKGP
jgi:hypothetical protein